MISFLFFLSSFILAEPPDNNTFLNEYKPPFVKKMIATKKKLEKKACVPFLETIECDVLSQINGIRMDSGMAALLPSEKCTKMAHKHTEYMVQLSNKGTPLSQSLNHDRFKERIAIYGLQSGKVSENVAAGSELMPQKAVRLWMNSRDHRKNILDPSVRYSGLAAIKDSKGNIFWTQCFSSKN